MINPYEHLTNQTDRVEIADQVVIFHFGVSPWQCLLGKTEVFLVAHHKDTGRRTAYRAIINKKHRSIRLCNKESSKDCIPATCSCLRRKSHVSILKEHLPKNSKFYFELAQNLGPFLETDYFTPEQEERYMDIKGIVGLIPCFNVEQYCEKVIEESLLRVEKLIVVDDGSTDNTKKIIQHLAQKYPDQLVFLNNPNNQGKGYCLLQGFKYCVENFNFTTLVTLDSDSQHNPADIVRLAEAIADGENFVIGTRTFLEMPFRSKISNIFISILLKIVFPHSPKETQSGYRAFDRILTEELVQHVKGGRYEMEFDCLLYALSQKKFIRGLPISTIYVDDNKSSKFDVFVDSYRIIKVLIRYAFQKR